MIRMVLVDQKYWSGWTDFSRTVFFVTGLAGFLSNIIQFGIDQLRDAPTTEITSFIVWYMWHGVLIFSV